MASSSSQKPKKPSLIGGIVLVLLGITLLVLGIWWEYFHRPHIDDPGILDQYLGASLLYLATFVFSIHFFAINLGISSLIKKWFKELEENRFQLRKTDKELKNAISQIKSLEEQLTTQAAMAATQIKQRGDFLSWINESLGEEKPKLILENIWRRLDANLPERHFDYWGFDEASRSFRIVGQHPPPEIALKGNPPLSLEALGEAHNMLITRKTVVYGPGGDSAQFSDEIQSYLKDKFACIVPIIHRSDLVGMLVASNPGREVWSQAQRLILGEASQIFSILLEKQRHLDQATTVWDQRNHWANLPKGTDLPVARIKFGSPVLIDGTGSAWDEHLSDTHLAWSNEAFVASQLAGLADWKEWVDASICQGFEDSHTQTVRKKIAGQPYQVLLVADYYKGMLHGYWAILLEIGQESPSQDSEAAFLMTLHDLNRQMQHLRFRAEALESIASSSTPYFALIDSEMKVSLASAASQAELNWREGLALSFVDEGMLGKVSTVHLTTQDGTDLRAQVTLEVFSTGLGDARLLKATIL